MHSISIRNSRLLVAAVLVGCSAGAEPAPVLDGAPERTCADLACGEHGVCDQAAGEPTCVCNPGYAVADADGSCADIDECAGEDHGCVLGCDNTEGSYACAVPQTCVDIRTEMPGSPDGAYELFVAGDRSQPWTAYCHDMAGAPREFLTLLAPGEDRNDSFSVRYWGATGTDVHTRYERIRIHPEDLTVDIVRQTFATSSGSFITMNGHETTFVPFASAPGCTGSFVTDGRANVDLTGTPFYVVSQFCSDGFNPAITVTSSPDRQIVDLTGGGFCGAARPAPCEDRLLALGYLGAPPE